MNRAILVASAILALMLAPCHAKDKQRRLPANAFRLKVPEGCHSCRSDRPDSRSDEV